MRHEVDGDLHGKCQERHPAEQAVLAVFVPERLGGLVCDERQEARNCSLSSG